MAGVELSERGLEALLNLETGVRSKVSEIRVQSVLRFISFFEEYPNPLLVNNAILKLSDYWWTSDNTFRQCILEVFRRCDRHLSKIISKDETLRRIISVLSSNDPIAKAFTLRLLGCIDCIIIDRVDVHHKIRLFLCQRNYIELNAAIYAADKSSATSSAFAEATFPGLEPIIKENRHDSLIAPKIINIYRNMHHTDELAQKALHTLLNLINEFEQENIHLCSIFRSMTILCLRAIHLVPAVLPIIINYLKRNPARVVQCTLLSCLRIITKMHSHRADSEKFMTLIHHGIESDDPVIMAKSFKVTALLCSHDIFVYRLLSDAGDFCRLLLEKFEEIQSKVNSISDTRLMPFVETIYYIHAYCKRNSSMGSYNEVIRTIENISGNYMQMIPSSIIKSGPRYLHHLKTLRYLSAIVNDSKVWENMLKAYSMLNYNTYDQNRCINEVVGSCMRITPSLVVRFLISNPTEIPDKTALNVIISYIKEMKASHCENPDVYYDSIRRIISKLSASKYAYWYKYLVACEALVSGQPVISVEIFEKLKSKVSSENSHNWIKALLQISNSSLIMKRDGPWLVTFSGVLNSLLSAVVVLKFIITKNNQWKFQIDYLELMIEVYTKIFHMVIMLETRDKKGEQDLRAIPLGVLASFVKKMKCVYWKLDDFTNTFSDLDKPSRNTIHNWANFCSMVSDLLEMIISQQKLFATMDNCRVPDLKFIEKYRSLQFMPLIDIGPKDESGTILVKDFLKSLVIILRNLEIVPRAFCRLYSINRPSSSRRNNWLQF